MWGLPFADLSVPILHPTAFIILISAPAILVFTTWGSFFYVRKTYCSYPQHERDPKVSARFSGSGFRVSDSGSFFKDDRLIRLDIPKP